MDKYAFSRVYEWFMFGLSHHAERRLKKWEVQINNIEKTEIQIREVTS